MIIKLSLKTITGRLIKSLEDVVSTLAGFWFHPFLTVSRLLERSGLTVSIVNFGITLLFIWLAQIIKQPQKLGYVLRLLIWFKIAGLVGLVFLILWLVVSLKPKQKHQILSVSFIFILPAIWLVGRSIWLILAEPATTIINFIFLYLTVLIGLIEVIFIYFWLRLIAKQPWLDSLAAIIAGGLLSYLFKQIICLWL